MVPVRILLLRWAGDKSTIRAVGSLWSVISPGQVLVCMRSVFEVYILKEDCILVLIFLCILLTFSSNFTSYNLQFLPFKK